MDALESLRDIITKVNRQKIRYPAIAELPPEGIGVNFDPSSAGSAGLYKEQTEKRIRRRFKLGQKVLFFIPSDGVFEEGTIIFRRGSDSYQVRSLFDRRNHLVDGRSLRPA